jgi:hypothetical protein
MKDKKDRKGEAKEIILAGIIGGIIFAVIYYFAQLIVAELLSNEDIGNIRFLF